MLSSPEVPLALTGARTTVSPRPLRNRPVWGALVQVFLDEQPFGLHFLDRPDGHSLQVFGTPLPGSRGVANGGHRVIEQGTFIIGASRARTIWIRLAVDHLAVID